MEEIIDRVLKAEQEAETTVQEARTLATEIRAQAEREVNAKIALAREQAQKIVQEGVAQARVKAEGAVQEARAQAEDLELMEKHKDKLRTIADEVTRLLITPEYKKG